MNWHRFINFIYESAASRLIISNIDSNGYGPILDVWKQMTAKDGLPPQINSIDIKYCHVDKTNPTGCCSDSVQLAKEKIAPFLYLMACPPPPPGWDLRWERLMNADSACRCEFIDYLCFQESILDFVESYARHPAPCDGRIHRTYGVVVHAEKVTYRLFHGDEDVGWTEGAVIEVFADSSFFGFSKRKVFRLYLTDTECETPRSRNIAVVARESGIIKNMFDYFYDGKPFVLTNLDETCFMDNRYWPRNEHSKSSDRDIRPRVPAWFEYRDIYPLGARLWADSNRFDNDEIVELMGNRQFTCLSSLTSSNEWLINGHYVKQIAYGLRPEIYSQEDAPLTSDEEFKYKELSNEALSLRKQGCYADSVTLAEKSVKEGTDLLGPDHPDLALAFDVLSDCYESLELFEESQRLYEQAGLTEEKLDFSLNRSLAIREKAHGKHHPILIRILSRLSFFHFKHGDFAKSFSLRERLLAIQEQHRGVEHEDVTATLGWMAFLCGLMKDYDVAESLLRRKIEILERRLGSSHPDVVECLSELADIENEKTDCA